MKISTNSTPNSTPAKIPARSVPSSSNSAIPRIRHQPKISTLAMAERTTVRNTGS
jgi:hypothetical protein